MAKENSEYKYDAALSFAGEDRVYVEEIADALKAADIPIFLDTDHAADMWGEDLVEYFDRVYRLESRFAIMFVSRHYADKPWTRAERRAALSRALEQKSAYVLPVRLDDTTLPGLLPTVGYLDANRTGIVGLVEALKRKLAGTPEGSAEGWPGDRVPRTPRELGHVVVQKPPAWEWLYFAGVLLEGRDALESKFIDSEIGYAALGGEQVDALTARPYLIAALADVTHVTQILMDLMSESTLEGAFGKPGSPGDAPRLKHLAGRWTAVYGEMLDWAARVRGTRHPGSCADAFRILARAADRPIHDYRAYVDEVVARIDEVPRLLAANEPVTMSLQLTLTVDEELLARFTAEVGRLVEEGEIG